MLKTNQCKGIIILPTFADYEKTQLYHTTFGFTHF